MEELLKKISCQSSKDDNEHSADQREVALSCQCFLLSKSQTDQYRRQNGKRNKNLLEWLKGFKR
jgi:hypothetical protein